LHKTVPDELYVKMQSRGRFIKVPTTDSLASLLCIVKICESVREDYSVITHNIYHLFTGSCWRCLLVWY